MTEGRTIEASELQEIERMAVELATLAGAEIQAALGSIMTVRYKGNHRRNRCGAILSPRLTSASKL